MCYIMKRKMENREKCRYMVKIYNVLDIALYVINYSAEKNKTIKEDENESGVSNLQLQKILYYIQAMFLVKKNSPCFNEKILRWGYGPVIKEAYDEFKCYGHDKIPQNANYIDIRYNEHKNKIEVTDKEYNAEIILREDKELINLVVNAYKDKKPFDLVDKTHKEDPWKNSAPNSEITIKDIKEYYLNNEEKILN